MSGGIKAGFRVRVATTIVWSRCFGSASATKGGKHGFTVGSVHHRRSAHCFNRSSVLFVHAEEKSDEGEKEWYRRQFKALLAWELSELISL